MSNYIASHLPDGSERCSAGTISHTPHNHGRCTRRTRVTLVDIDTPDGEAIPLCFQHRQVVLQRSELAEKKAMGR